jgi:hypothetical protein
MHRRFPIVRTLVLSLAAILLAACDTPPSAPPPQAIAKVKTMGIISSLGTALNFERIGVGGYDNDFYHVPTPQLGLDPYIVDLVAKQLAGRFDVRPVQYSPGDFVGSATSDDTMATITSRIRSSAKPADLDAYLLVLSAVAQMQGTGQLYDRTAQEVGGLGVYRKAYIGQHYYYAHATYIVVLVDGHSGKVLSETGAPGGYQKLGFLEFPKVGGPYLDVDENVWPEADPQHPAPALVTKLVEQTLKPLLAESVGPTLKAAKLIP